MAQIAVAAVSLALGFYAVSRAMKMPDQKLGDVARQTAKEGEPRSIVYGVARPVTGNIIAVQDPPHIERRENSGGGKGGGGSSYTSEHPRRTYAIGVCEGPIKGYGRIWRNNKLVYDGRPGSAWGVTNNVEFLKRATLYHGSYDQLPDPELQAIFGVDNVTAHRGTAYIVIKDEDLSETGGAVPSYTFEVMRDIASTDILTFTVEPYNTAGVSGLGLQIDEFDLLVDFGDGSEPVEFKSTDGMDIIKTYDNFEQGTRYQIKVSGTANNLRFGPNIRQSVVSVERFGTQFTDGDGIFRDMYYLEQVPDRLPGYFESLAGAFSQTRLIGTSRNDPSNIDPDNFGAKFWNTSKIKDMNNCFAGNISTTNTILWYMDVDVTDWDTSSVTNMSGMFKYRRFFEQDLGAWNVSNVTNMSDMFMGTIRFNSDLSAWDVSNVTNMRQMFRDASNGNALLPWQPGFEQSFAAWDVSNVTDMRGMFYGSRIIEADLSAWNTSNVTNMYQMFSNCQVSIPGPDLTNWDVSKVTDMREMFEFCGGFNRDIGLWDVSKVTDMRRMFRNAYEFDQDLSGWCVDNIASEPHQFSEGSPLLAVNKPVWGTCPGQSEG